MKTLLDRQHSTKTCADTTLKRVVLVPWHQRRLAQMRFPLSLGESGEGGKWIESTFFPRECLQFPGSMYAIATRNPGPRYAISLCHHEPSCTPYRSKKEEVGDRRGSREGQERGKRGGREREERGKGRRDLPLALGT